MYELIPHSNLESPWGPMRRERHAHLCSCYRDGRQSKDSMHSQLAAMTEDMLPCAANMSPGWKMRQFRLISLVSVEAVRIDAVRVQQLPYIFQRLPLNARGNLPLSEVCGSAGLCCICAVSFSLIHESG